MHFFENLWQLIQTAQYVLFGLLFVVVLLIGWALSIASREPYEKVRISVPGRVRAVKRVWGGHRRFSLYWRYEYVFTDINGKEQVMHQYTGHFAPIYSVGAEVSIQYDPNDLSCCLVDGEGWAYANVLLVRRIAIAFVLLWITGLVVASFF